MTRFEPDDLAVLVDVPADVADDVVDADEASYALVDRSGTEDMLHVGLELLGAASGITTLVVSGPMLRRVVAKVAHRASRSGGTLVVTRRVATTRTVRRSVALGDRASMEESIDEVVEEIAFIRTDSQH